MPPKKAARVTLTSLPPELVLEIVQHVELAAVNGARIADMAANVIRSGMPPEAMTVMLQSLAAFGNGVPPPPTDLNAPAAPTNATRPGPATSAATTSQAGTRQQANGTPDATAAAAQPAIASTAAADGASSTSADAGASANATSTLFTFGTGSGTTPFTYTNSNTAATSGGRRNSDSGGSLPDLVDVNPTPSASTLQTTQDAQTVPSTSNTEVSPVSNLAMDSFATGSDDEEEDYDVDYDDYDSCDEDEDEDSEDEAERLIYPDGLPAEPLLPLLFVSRSFLHAARGRLYRNICITSPYSGSLLVRSLEASKHAAHDPADGEDVPPGAAHNRLSSLVRSLHINGTGSVGRDGHVYLRLLKLCPHLECLNIQPSFLASLLRPLLNALASLGRLNKVALASSPDETHPMILTVPRLEKLMRSWPDLEELSIDLLQDASAGRFSEEDDMYERIDRDENGPYSDDSDDERNDLVSPKPRGLKSLLLQHPTVYGHEIEVILTHSTNTLTHLSLKHPAEELTRRGLASVILTFGHNLTHLNLDMPGEWDPQVKKAGKVGFPLKRKGYTASEPTYEDILSVATHPYFLDVLVGYLPKLVEIQFTGALASTTVFSIFAPSVRVVAWSLCPDIKPAQLGRLLRKKVDRTKTVVQADGTKTSRAIKTIVSKGLQCMTVGTDDLSWSFGDLKILREAVYERGVCLHLSGDDEMDFGNMFDRFAATNMANLGGGAMAAAAAAAGVGAGGAGAGVGVGGGAAANRQQAQGAGGGGAGAGAGAGVGAAATTTTGAAQPAPATAANAQPAANGAPTGQAPNANAPQNVRANVLRNIGVVGIGVLPLAGLPLFGGGPRP